MADVFDFLFILVISVACTIGAVVGWWWTFHYDGAVVFTLAAWSVVLTIFSFWTWSDFVGVLTGRGY